MNRRPFDGLRLVVTELCVNAERRVGKEEVGVQMEAPGCLHPSLLRKKNCQPEFGVQNKNSEQKDKHRRVLSSSKSRALAHFPFKVK